MEDKRCPHCMRKLAGDETYELCGINDKSCLIEHGLYKCDIYEEYLVEYCSE